MSARLSLVAALPKLKHLTREEAARRLNVSLEELEEANRFALVTFADPDPEFPPPRPRPKTRKRYATGCRSNGEGITNTRGIEETVRGQLEGSSRER